jgi:serine/threonine protein phosphatase 1
MRWKKAARVSTDAGRQPQSGIMLRSRSKSKSRLKPRLPDGVRIYAVSDIHGCADLLRNVFAAIDLHLARSEPVRALHVFLGDYIDRGPASRETIDLLIERSLRHESIFLKGNHEAFMFEVLRDPSRLLSWKEYGGFQTLLSYGLTPPMSPNKDQQDEIAQALMQCMPKHHRYFYNTLRTSFSYGDFFFAHAGVKPGVPLRQQREEDLLWIRDEFLQSEADFGHYVVHGHTPVAKPEIRPNRINIDTGAYATGILTLLTIQGERMFTI